MPTPSNRAPTSRTPRRRTPDPSCREHTLEQAPEHDEIVGVVRLFHLAVRDATRARPHRHDGEAQRGEHLEPFERAYRVTGQRLVRRHDVVTVHEALER